MTDAEVHVWRPEGESDNTYLQRKVDAQRRAIRRLQQQLAASKRPDLAKAYVDLVIVAAWRRRMFDRAKGSYAAGFTEGFAAGAHVGRNTTLDVLP